MNSSEDFYLGPARNFSEICAAFKLVQMRYLDLGYALPNKSGMRFTFQNLLNTSTTFVAVMEGSVLATATLMIDSPAGLPLQSVFKREHYLFRRQYALFGEGTMFACQSDFENKGMGIIIHLVRIIFDYCLDQGINTFFIVVHPKHVGFYQKVLGFEIVSSANSCHHVRGVEGVLLRRRVETMQPNKTDIIQRLMRNYRSPPELVKPYRLSEGDIDHLILQEPEVKEQYLNYRGLLVNAKLHVKGVDHEIKLRADT